MRPDDTEGMGPVGTNGPCLNTDRHLWPDTSAPNAPHESVFVTIGGGIGINVGGHVIVMALSKWHELAQSRQGESPIEGTTSERIPKAERRSRESPALLSSKTVTVPTELLDRVCFEHPLSEKFDRALNELRTLARRADETSTGRSVTLNGYQLRNALEFCAPDNDADQLESDVSIQWGDAGHSGAGYYACCAEYPEEGSILLDDKRPDCPHKTDAPKDAPADPDCTWCQSAVKTSDNPTKETP